MTFHAMTVEFTFKGLQWGQGIHRRHQGYMWWFWRSMPAQSCC